MPFLLPVDKKSHKTKLEIDEEHKIANSSGTAFITPIFLGF